MSNNPWAEGGNDGGWEDVGPRRDGQSDKTNQPVPSVLRPGGAFDNQDEQQAWGDARGQPSFQQSPQGTPAALQPGGDKAETNPFLRKKVPQRQDQPPTDSFAKLGLDEPSTNPWQPAMDGQNGSLLPAQPTPQNGSLLPPQTAPQPIPNLMDDSIPRDRWTPTPEPLPAGSPGMVSQLSDRDSPGWDEDPLGRNDKPPALPMKVSAGAMGDGNIWDDWGSADKGKNKATEEARPGSPDDWNLIESEPSTSPTKEDAPEKPPLPPRQPTLPTEGSSWRPSRDPIDGKTETYQIKNIQWHDSSASKNPRTSPILIQNANGPCPLVALVNALTLTTPADIEDTALVQTLRSREQVSLNLLLDAVFDELMSPRRTSSEDALPDVGDLYAFLQSLHTGMNVNPRFIPTDSIKEAYKRTSLTHLHPAERGDLIPGTFENTAEMGLYATFSIPLIHGWLPPKNDHVYEALERQAGSYEDVQNLLFREEELEQKLSDPDGGLTESEQQLYQDIMIIKEFLENSATQLTPYGIEVIGKAIRPGTFAILFRNDHFSTLYCHPQSMQLITLVTDAGFKSHDGIVWETLSDINGGNTEYLSGDFRVVGSGGAAPSTSAGNYSSNDGGEWTTVQNRRGKAPDADEAPTSTSAEQEDRDLALALQLQEEEEERHRAEEARRRRESMLSEQFIEQQALQPPNAARGNRGGRGGPGAAPSGRGARGGGVTRGASGLVPGRNSSVSAPTTNMTNAQPRVPVQRVRSLIPAQPPRPAVSRAPDEATDDAPPSYEQSAHDRTYQPPVGHPSHPSSSPTISRQTTAASVNSSIPPGQRPFGQFAGRRPSGPGVGVNGGQRDRDCVVM
ncbi:hypothetical protein FIE12Z_6327 [Fusarium flagelliforme]|uniref:MINDY deubiquitinase domain-containing protein n=1 Tax=Fusarium flagelliforme TaxID=2675880 RepID=A0A395MND9_9HYPO|nr:hypothetical protein FIE12Z_6327 [Fusarium flagelliforme]